MIHAIADTHVLIWHLFDSTRLSDPAKAELDLALNSGTVIGLSAISNADKIINTINNNKQEVGKCLL